MVLTCPLLDIACNSSDTQKGKQNKCGQVSSHVKASTSQKTKNFYVDLSIFCHFDLIFGVFSLISDTSSAGTFSIA